MSHSTLYEAILNGDNKAAVAATRAALAANADPLELVTKAMIPAMDEVGRLFELQEYFVPEMLLSGRAMRAAIDLLRPLLVASGAQPTGRVVIGTVAGDLHDIGKNLVASMLQGGGFEVTDLGTDVKPERFVEAVEATKADIVALSALLTVTMPAMELTIDAMRSAGIRDRVKVMIGGAPVTPQYSEKIGADGYCESASGVVALARNFMAERHAH
ncbi:MAG TPA: corrinoid protein [Terriglobales bacterium]|nr:corrinoid protein [Terriglobales bacterium]